MENHIDLNDFSKVVIYQFGKVGSSTLRETFKKLGKKTIHSHLWKNEFLYNNKGKTLIINVVRKINDRNISALFQNIKNNNEKDWYFNGRISNFYELSTHFNKCHSKEMEWMGSYYKNLGDFTGFSVLDGKWDENKKYLYFEGGKCNCSLLVLRFEDIKEWESIFEKLLGFKIKLINSNRSETKNIYFTYQKFKKIYQYSKEQIAQIWNVDFMKFFYKNENPFSL